jgi:cytochrome P450
LADLTDLDNFAHGFPHELFAEHRRMAPVYWHPATRHTPDGEGFWSVATHAETLAVLRDPSTFSSARLVQPLEWTRSNRHTGIRHLVVELAA